VLKEQPVRRRPYRCGERQVVPVRLQVAAAEKLRPTPPRQACECQTWPLASSKVVSGGEAGRM
jgi:hypothetical protein